MISWPQLLPARSAAVCVFCSSKINPLQTLQQHHFLLFRALLEMAVMIRGTKVPVVQWLNYDSNVFKVFNRCLVAKFALCKKKKTTTKKTSEITPFKAVVDWLITVIFVDYFYSNTEIMLLSIRPSDASW